MQPLTRTLAAVLSASVATCAAAAPSRIPVEVWRGGDDGLTSRFAGGLESAFRASRDFSLSKGDEAGALVVTIESNLTTKRVGFGDRAYYVVVFGASDSKQLGSTNGSCWERELQACIAKVVEAARTASAKLADRAATP